MPTEKRLQYFESKHGSQPGPGNYDSPSKLGKDCPNYTIGEKRGDLNKRDIPGPGTYDARDTLSKERPHSAFIGQEKRGNFVESHGD